MDFPVSLREPQSGDYTFQVIGTDTGTYDLTLNAVNNQGDFNQTEITGVTEENLTSSFDASFSSTSTEPTSIEKEVTFESIRKEINIALEIGLIDNQGITKSILQKLDSAERDFNRNSTKTKNILNALKLEIEAQKDKLIDESFASTLIKDIEELSDSPVTSNSFLQQSFTDLKPFVEKLSALLLFI